MATFTDATAFANHIAGYGKRIESADSRALRAELEAITLIVKKHGARYRIKGRSGGRFGLGAKMSGPYGYGGTSIGYIDADPAGFWAIIERGAGPHIIRPRRRGRGGRGSKRALTTPYGIFAIVHHPGTGGSIGHPWASAVAEAKVVGPKVYEHALVSSVFGVAA
jgi:hypothetical protein